jgi:hypothetical protein
MMGHSLSGGGEGRIRYDKGLDLKAAAATLALLRHPEVDLSHQHGNKFTDKAQPN